MYVPYSNKPPVDLGSYLLATSWKSLLSGNQAPAGLPLQKSYSSDYYLGRRHEVKGLCLSSVFGGMGYTKVRSP